MFPHTSEIIIIVLGVSGLIAGAMLLWKIRYCLDDIGDVAESTRATVIIPARNEAGTLPELLTSLKSQECNIEMLVVDDHSEDSTAEIAQSLGARVISSDPLPVGWSGKTWACYQGAQHASNEILIFLDADTIVHPGGLKRMIATFNSELAVMSIAPFHITKKLHEQFSAIFNMIVISSVNAFSAFSSHRTPSGLFGPCLMVKRSDYNRIDGHSSVKSKILENLYMAEKFKEAGIPMTCFGGRGVLSYRMYPVSLKQLIEGWGKAFVSGAKQTEKFLTLLISFWFAGLVSVPVYLLATALLPNISVSYVILSLYFLYVIEQIWALRRIGSFFLITGAFYPLTVFFSLGVFCYSFIKSIRGSGVQWKGRKI
ncbi:MAG: glycosyltransferase [Candidatus Latescibacteria bacterium]|nr:glycosyltransferase [Candidatus Latescibacterota bacterium]